MTASGPSFFSASDDLADEFDELDEARREAAATFQPPDAVALVLESDFMMSVYVAERLVRIDAARREALAEAAAFGRTLTDVVERGIRLEIAAALRITEYRAGMLIRLAEAAVQRHPVILHQIERAAMTEDHALVLVDAIDAVEPHLQHEVLERGIECAAVEQLGTFRRTMKDLVESLRVETLAERHQREVAHRRVAVEAADDGMAWLHVYAPAVEVHAVYGRATAMAKLLRTADGETRSLDQLRTDIVCDLLIDGRTTAHPTEVSGVRANVTVTVPALALLGLSDAGHATVEGVGPIPMSKARELCGGAHDWTRVLTHPETGAVVSVGRDRYRPPRALRDLVRWRSERCMAPGCGVPAARCQLDHTVAWEYGGPTELTNLAPLCQGHHTVKHHGGWRIRQSDDGRGAIEWTSPSGRHYVVHPRRATPVFRASGSDPTDTAPF